MKSTEFDYPVAAVKYQLSEIDPDGRPFTLRLKSARSTVEIRFDDARDVEYLVRLLEDIDNGRRWKAEIFQQTSHLEDGRDG